MIKCIVIGNLRVHVHLLKCWSGTCWSVEMLKGYMLICRNAEGVHGQRNVGNPWVRRLRIRRTETYTKYRNSAGTDGNV